MNKAEKDEIKKELKKEFEKLVTDEVAKQIKNNKKVNDKETKEIVSASLVSLFKYLWTRSNSWENSL